MGWVAEEHGMWHAENGPSGPYGVPCPWDACGWAAAEDAWREEEYRLQEEEWAAAAPALRDGEEPAPPFQAFRPDDRDVPAPWDLDPAFSQAAWGFPADYDPPF
jgi:hypothetical protein